MKREELFFRTTDQSLYRAIIRNGDEKAQRRHDAHRSTLARVGGEIMMEHQEPALEGLDRTERGRLANVSVAPLNQNEIQLVELKQAFGKVEIMQ